MDDPDAAASSTASRPIGLVLGGGGGRGFAHIGVLRALNEHGLRPVAVAGSSTGSIIAALHAAGNTPERIEAIVRQASPLRLFDVGQRGGLVGGDGIEAFLAEHLPARFEQLTLPLLVTATDLERGELVVLRSGPLVPALRASNSLPGLISPLRLDGRLLVDGGVRANLPVGVIGAATDAPVVAVDVSPALERPVRLPEEHNWWQRLRSVLRSGEPGGAIDVMLKSIELMQEQNTRSQLAQYPPALLIRPDLPHDMGVEDFGRLDEAVAIGYRSAVAALRDSVLEAG